MLHTFYSSCRRYRNCITTPKTSKIYFLLVLFFLICLFLVRKRHIHIHLFLVRKSICYKYTRSFRQKSISIYFLFFSLLYLKMLTFFLFLFTFLLFLCTSCIHFFYHFYHFPKTTLPLFSEQ